MFRIAIFISGRGTNMQAITKEVNGGVLKGLCQIALVFSNKCDAAGLTFARQEGLPVACIESAGKKRSEFDRQVIELLQPYSVDYIILAGYMRILSPQFIRAYPSRIINIHPADTRQHQGQHAYQWAFTNQLSQTAITIHYVNEGVDTGQIIAQQTVNLTGATTLEEVEQRGLQTEYQLYSQTLANLFLSELNKKQ